MRSSLNTSASAPRPRRSILPALAFCAVLAAACRKSPAPAPSASKPVDLSMPATPPASTDVDASREKFYGYIEKRYSAEPEKAKAMAEAARGLDAELDAVAKLAQFNRLTMVLPAPADFKPEPVARKIRLKLILEKYKLRVGERPRFRLEMTNVGREAIDYSETRASVFVKDGDPFNSPTIGFFIDGPGEHRTRLTFEQWPADFEANRPQDNGIQYLPDSMPQAEKEKWVRDVNAMGSAHAHFSVKLLPGETLHSVGDDDSPRENFKTLFGEPHLDKPGKYRLQVVLDDRPEPLTEQHIKDAASFASPETLRKWHAEAMRDALGPASSNTAVIEVVP
jgi:hypothetical protein